MKRKPGLIGVLYAAILAAIAGYFFRTAQLSGGSSVPVVAFSVLMVLGVSVKIVGVGEGPVDLYPFDAEGFVEVFLAYSV